MNIQEKAATYDYRRQVSMGESYDLIVAGGGPAGTAAAICAARQGAKVLLLEAIGCLGGMGTSALVSSWADVADGERMIAGGLIREVIETMYARGYLKPGVDPDKWRKALHDGFGFNPEGLKLLLDELCRKAGVEVRFFTRVIDVDVSGSKVNGVVVHNIEGLRYIEARAFVDATGDAVLADLCGVPCREAGRDTPGIMPPTLCSTHAGIDWVKFDWGNHWQRHIVAIEQAIAEGFFSQPDRHVPGLFVTGRTTGMLNAGHVFGMNALNCRSLSEGIAKGRQLAEEFTRFYRKYMPGCENMEFVATASLMGVRESRRIVGEYELNYADFQARREFPDQICVCNNAVDIHVYDCSDEEWDRHRNEFMAVDRPGAGETYGLPYGILVPKDSTNLWVAGRCNSSDIKVNGAIRLQPTCFMMGEAAGTAAVQSIRTGQPACALDTSALVETLRAAGGHLPQAKLSRRMTASA